MKKRYYTPECKTVYMETVSFLANSYSNDQGRISYDATEVSADEAD